MRKRRIASSFSEADEPLINLTPLIDVVFVVLIIFILVAPMLEVDRIKLASSSEQSQRSSVNEASPIAIQVREDNTIWVHQKKVSFGELLTTLSKEKKKHPTQIPQLFHDKKAHFGTYQQVKNAVEEAGFAELDVILQPGSP